MNISEQFGARSLWLALLIVSIATAALLVADPGDVSDWPLVAQPIKPAWVFAIALGGGPQEVASKWYDGPATFTLAVAMWWGILEGCRGLWRVWRRRRG